MSINRFLTFFLFPFVCSAQTPPDSYREAIGTVLEDWKNDKDLKNASIGFSVMDAKTSSVVAEYNSHLSLIPASTLKVVTTSAALGLLGKDYRYETKLYYSGAFNKQTGILNGNLIIVGSGDPSLQSENFVKDSSLVTDKWAKILKEKGLKEIRGKIIGEASCFERAIPDTWIWSDIGNYFGAAPCGLSFMDNKFKIMFESGETGSKASITKISPQYITTTITVNSSVIAKGNEDEAFVYGDPFSYTKDISGKIPPNKKNFEVEAALPDPALLCAEMLCNSLLKIGISCNQKSAGSNYKKSDTIPAKQLLYSYASPPLDQLVLYTNLKSNNQYCEALLRTMGKGNVAAGIETVKNYWQKRGLDVSEVFMSDASGLSRANTITTHFQTGLLCKVYRDSVNYRSFNYSLPVAGKSGSMSNIGKNKFIENNMRAKTGYINRARGYCGYLRTKSGTDLAFSVLFNNYNCSPKEAKLKIEKFLVALGEL
ncbi:MAG: D-alanyl-D-alanine carboxypeptidase/D-alanyl-D-alanine-endopeptidase [Bacteroidota bacterium]